MKISLLVTLAACHQNVDVPVPPLDGVGSVLLWVYADRELTGVFAIDVVDGQLTQPPNAVYLDDLELLAMTFACPSADVGLTPGKQELLEVEYDFEKVRTPPPREMLAFDPREGTEWRTMPAMDPRMLDTILHLDLEANNVCDRYSVPYAKSRAEIPTAPNTNPVFAIPAGTDRILVGMTNGELFQVAQDGSYSEVRDLGLPALPETIDFKAAYREDDGTMWLYAFDGRVARGSLEAGFTFISEVSTATGGAIALDGSRGGAPLEILAAGADRRRLVRFDGARWETLFEGDETPICDLGFFDVVLPPVVSWIGPSEALAIGAGESRGSVLRYKDGAAFEEPFPAVAGDPATVLETDLGTFATTCEGDIVKRGDVTWEPAFPTRAETSFPIIAITRAAGPGLVYAGNRMRTAVLAQFHPSIGYCREMESLPGFGRFMVRLGGTIFLVMARRDNEPLIIVLLEEGDPPCLAVRG
jgi:hypothetical protein